MKHLASNTKNIKDSLTRMCKYILGKSINKNKTNSIRDFKSIGKTAWKFIFAIYKVYWNGLYVNDSRTLFRNKVKSKFNSQVNKILVNGKDKETVKTTYISSLLSPILVKLPKKVNEISKFFKKNLN